MNDTEKPNQCWHAAFDVARRYREFGSYGSEEKAVRALRRRCPHLNPDEANRLLSQALGLWTTAVEVVEQNKHNLWQQHLAGSALDLTPCDSERARRCPEVPVETWQTALGWAWYWHHLK